MPSTYFAVGWGRLARTRTFPKSAGVASEENEMVGTCPCGGLVHEHSYSLKDKTLVQVWECKACYRRETIRSVSQRSESDRRSLAASSAS